MVIYFIEFVDKFFRISDPVSLLMLYFIQVM